MKLLILCRIWSWRYKLRDVRGECSNRAFHQKKQRPLAAAWDVFILFHNNFGNRSGGVGWSGGALAPAPLLTPARLNGYTNFALCAKLV
jgi:hypothetical protein